MDGSSIEPLPLARSISSFEPMPPIGAPLPLLRFFFVPGAATKSPARLSSWFAMVPGVAEPAAAEPPPLPSPERSCMSVVFATAQPLPRPPMMASSATFASDRNTSLNRAWPVISTSGRTSTPSWCMSNANQVMPWCLGCSGSVRAMSMPRSAMEPNEVHTF